MSTGEDESSPGLNGRLRPRKSTITTPSPQNKSTRKSEGKLTEDKLKKTATPSKALPSKHDDLTTKPDASPTPSYLCPYCDRKFTSKQTASKHARRIHISTSRQDNFIKCLYCNHSEAEGNNIIKHMVDNHPNQYFACLDCYTRFSVTLELAEHKHNVCEKQKPSYRSKLRQKSTSRTKKNTKRSNAHDKIDIQNENTECLDEHRFNGIVISCELKPSQTHDAADIEDNLTTNLILPPSKALGKSGIEKSGVIVLDDIQWNKRLPPNFSFHNADADQILSRLGVVHRSPRVGDSTKKDWIKIVDGTVQKFERCFDTNFYSKVTKNVQENLTKYLDGTFNFNPAKENTIKTRKSKTSVAINTAEGFPILLAYEQYSRNILDGYMPRPLAPKHKWKWDSAETDKNVPILVDNSKRDSHVNNCIVTLVSSLDIWTQLQMRRKFEEIFKTTPVAKKTEKQNIIGRELKEILESRDIPSYSSQVVKYEPSSVVTSHSTELPAHLGLTPVTPKCELQPAVLSGEWVRPRCYVCCACGEQTNDARTLSSHISTQHPNAQVQHYEIVGETLLSADILKHLYVPPSQMSNRTRPPRGFRDCTKCKKSITLEDLHQHMLDCAGDTPTVRRKCRYRPFGVRRRRPRLPDNTIRKKMRKDIRNHHRQKCNLRTRPRIRTEVGDAETIRKMIADLPAKRNRISLPISRPRRNILTAKKTIKLRASDDKTTKIRSGKKIVRPKKAVAIKKHQVDVDNSSNVDEDDQPLKFSSTCDSTKTKSLNKSIAKRVKKSNFKDRINHCKRVDKSIGSKKSPKSIHDSIINQSPMPLEHQKVDVNGAGPSSFVRQHSNRSNSSNKESGDHRPTGERNDGNERRNITPAPELPFKQCIGNATFSSETLDQSRLPNDNIFLPESESNVSPLLIADSHMTFENETVADKFDKPPLRNDNCNNFELAGTQIEKPKSSKNKKGLEHCIAMLRNKKGLPGPCKNEKKQNLIKKHNYKMIEGDLIHPKTNPSFTIPALLEHVSDKTFVCNTETSNQSKATQQISDSSMSISAQPSSSLHAYLDSSLIDNKSVSPKGKSVDDTVTIISPRRRFSGLTGTSATVVPSSNASELVGHWVSMSTTAPTYIDMNPSRRNSYDPALSARHSFYQNAMPSMSVPHMQNVMHAYHPQMMMMMYNSELYAAQLKAGLAGDNSFTPYGPLHQGQTEATHAVSSAFRKRRDSTIKETVLEAQKERKRKATPDKQFSVSTTYSDKLIKVSPNHRFTSAMTPPETPIRHAPKPTASRIYRDSQKRSIDAVDPENTNQYPEDISPYKIPKKSPIPNYPENTGSDLQNVRRHSMDVGVPVSSISGNHEVGLYSHRALNDRDLLSVTSPHSRIRSESRTTTPDEYTRRSADDQMRQDINEKNGHVFGLRHDLHGNSDKPAVARNNSLNPYLRSFENQIDKQTMDYLKKIQNQMKVSESGGNTKSNLEASKKLMQDYERHKQGLNVIMNNPNSTNPTELIQSTQIADVQIINVDSKNVDCSIRSLSDTSELSVNAFQGSHAPPVFSTQLQNSSLVSYNSGQYSDNILQHSSLRVSPSQSYGSHIVNHSQAYNRLQQAHLSEPKLSSKSGAETTDLETLYPLDLSQKERRSVEGPITQEPVRNTEEVLADFGGSKYQIDDSAKPMEVNDVARISPRSFDIKDKIDEQKDIPDSTQSSSLSKEPICSSDNTVNQLKSVSDHFCNEKVSEKFSIPLIRELDKTDLQESVNQDLRVDNSIQHGNSDSSKTLIAGDITINTDSTEHFDYKSIDFASKPDQSNINMANQCQIQSINKNYTNLMSLNDGQNIRKRNDTQGLSSESLKISDNTYSETESKSKDSSTDTIKETEEGVVYDKNIHVISKPEESSENVENITSSMPDPQIKEPKHGIINVDEEIDTSLRDKQSKEVDVDNLRKIMKKLEIQLNNEETVNDDDDYFILAKAISTYNLVLMINMLSEYPKLMNKIKAAIVNGVIGLSPTTPESAPKNACEQVSAAVSSSGVIPKKRYSPSQLFGRLSSTESCSSTSEVHTVNLPSNLQVSEQNVVSEKSKTILNENLEDNKETQSDLLACNIFGSAANQNKTLKQNVLLTTAVTQDIITQHPTKQRNFNEKTASLRAVRIKAPLSRKSALDDKNYITLFPNDIHGNTNTDVFAMQTDITSNSISVNESRIQHPYNDQFSHGAEVTVSDAVKEVNLIDRTEIHGFYDQSNYCDYLEKQANTANEKINVNTSSLIASNVRDFYIEEPHTRATTETTILDTGENLRESILEQDSLNRVHHLNDVNPHKNIEEADELNVQKLFPEVNPDIPMVNTDNGPNLKIMITEAEPDKVSEIVSQENCYNNENITGEVMPLFNTQDKNKDAISEKSLRLRSQSFESHDDKIETNSLTYMFETETQHLRPITNIIKYDTNECSSVTMTGTVKTLDSTSPKSKKSDGDDSEDDVTLADILKKRKFDNVCTSGDDVYDCVNVASSVNGTEESQVPVNEVKTKGDVYNEYTAPNNTQLPWVSTSVTEGSNDRDFLSHDNVINEIKVNYQDEIILEKTELKMRLLPDDESKEISCDTIEVHELNKNITYEDRELIKDNKTDPSSSEGIGIENRVECSNFTNINECNSGFPNQKVLNYNEKDIIIKEAVSEIISSENDAIDKNICEHLGVSSSKGLPTCTEGHDVDPLPLRRSRRGKSAYIVEDYDYIMLEDADESKKIPLTMKRLILSRVEKDNNDGVFTPPLENCSISNKVKNVDDIPIPNTNLSNASHSNKSQSSKRKQSTHSKRKIKKSKSSSAFDKVLSNSDSDKISISQITKEETETEIVDNNDGHAELKTCPDTTISTGYNSMVTNNIGKEDVNFEYKKTSLPGKRKKTKTLSSKSKKVKYSKMNTNSDLDSEDERDLTKIKMKHASSLRSEVNKIREDYIVDRIVPSKNIIEMYDIGKQANNCDVMSSSSAHISSEVRTACYNRQNLNKRPRLQHVSKKGTIDYDPYNIDFEDMIETSKPSKKKNKSFIRKVKNNKSAHRKNLDVDKNISLMKNIDNIELANYVQNDNSDTDSESSKSDVPLQKYVDEKCIEFDHKSRTEIKLNEDCEELKDDFMSKDSSDSSVSMVFCEEEGSPVNSNSMSGRQNSKNKKSIMRSKKDDTPCETDSVNIDQNLNMNNNRASVGQSKHLNKEKKNRRTLAVYNDVDSSVVSIEVDQQIRSDKFMENFGFYSEKIPRKSNLLASKKISETFHMISNESDDSYLGYKEIKSTKKSLLNENKKSEEEDNISEDPESSTNAENSLNHTFTQTTDAASSNQHCDLSINLPQPSTSQEYEGDDNVISQICIESNRSQSPLTTNPPKNMDTNIAPIEMKDDSLKTFTSIILEEDMGKSTLNKSNQTNDLETTKKATKNTVNKHSDKQFVVKSKMYPDIEEIDLLEDKFDKIKRKRRSQAVAAKQIQTVNESTASNKSRKQPERRKNPRNTKKKYANSHVPTKGALKGFESIKISIPTQDLNMPLNVSPPRQQKKRKKSKRRKGTSESGSSCGEYDDKGKLVQDRDVYEFKDNEDTELLELRPSTVMDRFRSIHKKNKGKNKDKGKSERAKYKEKSKDRRHEVKDKYSGKEDRHKSYHSSKHNNLDKELNLQDRERDVEVINTEREEVYRYKNNDLKKGGTKSVNLTLEQDNDVNVTVTKEENYLMETSFRRNGDDNIDYAVSGTSGFVPDRCDESDYESGSSIEGGCIVYKSDEFNCLCQSDVDSDESDVERSCGKLNCIYRNRNADKNTAIGNIFKNNAVRCDKNDTKDEDKSKPNLDQLFDSLLETKTNDDELAELNKFTAINQDNLSTAADIWCHEAEKRNLYKTSLLNTPCGTLESRQLAVVHDETSSVFDNVIKNKEEVDEISFKSDESSLSKSNFDIILNTPNIPNKTGMYMMVSTKSTQTGLPDEICESDMTNKNNNTDTDDDEFDINAKESDEWMVFQQLICPASKASQTDLTKLLYHCDQHTDCNLDCQSAFNKYLKDISPSEICVVVTTRASQTVTREPQIHEADTDYPETIEWNLTKEIYGVETIDTNAQTDSVETIEHDDRAAASTRPVQRRTSSHKKSKRSKIDRVKSSIQNDERSASVAQTSTAEMQSTSKISDEGASTSHDCGANTALDEAGVARQRARRKCTVGKQNVLAEHWSSESEAEGAPPRRNSADSVATSVGKKKRGKKKESGGKRGSRHGSKKETKQGSQARDDSSDESEPEAGPSRPPPGPKMRAWPRLQYSSEEGEEEQDKKRQHGWIVGDSHKKLVTMLAHAKGIRRAERRLKEQ